MSNRLKITGQSRGRAGIAALMAVFAIGASAVGAWADVTVVSTSTQTGVGGGVLGGVGAAPGDKGTKTVTRKPTIYYKAHKMRIDPGDNGAILILDGDSGAVVMLNPVQKTYFRMDGAAGPMAQLAAGLKLNTTASVTPTAMTRTIAGKLTHGYTYVVDVEMVPDPKMAASMGGMTKAGKPIPKVLETIHIDGEEWVADIASLPNKGAGAVKVSMQSFAALLPGMKALVDKMGAVPGVPIADRQSVTMQLLVGPDTQKHAMVTTTTASKVTESTLPDSLFAVPANYKVMSDKPATPES